jgi:SAM-dependent methyltransferase
MRTKVLSSARLAQLRRHPALYRRLRSARFAVGALLPPKAVPGIRGRLSRNDFMLGGTSDASVQGYLEYGRRTAQLVVSWAEKAGLDPARATGWLELGCGYGRVVRFLPDQGVPLSAVFVTDVIPAAMRFCERELGVTAVPSLRGRTDLHGRFEVIYAISVFTHLPPQVGNEVLASAADALAPGGILLFSTHGESCVDNAQRYGPEFAGVEADIRGELDRAGVSYRPYIYVKDASYGVTWHTEAYVDRMVQDVTGAAFTRIGFEPQGVERHQDLHVFRRSA